jgi:8-oxo-dGTP pyrophosphatase MutT (NUDIX family)
MIDLTAVRRLLEAFDPGPHAHDVDGPAQTIALITDKADPFDRTDYDPGHITASAIVLSPDGESVVLVNHARVGLWIQPGGHVEPDDSTLVDAARREVEEETGIILPQTKSPSLVRVDVHEIPPFKNEPCHLHHDLTFGFQTDVRQTDIGGDSEWAWCEVPDLGRWNVDPALQKSIRRVQTLHLE